MPETKNEPTLTADPDGSVWEGENCIADIGTGDGGRDAALARLWAAAPETKRQRDALLASLKLISGLPYNSKPHNPQPCPCSLCGAYKLISECDGSADVP
jgi:hypothetical protein